MIPRNHPSPTGLVSSPGNLDRLESTWSPFNYSLFDGRLEEWLLDQLAVSTLPTDMKLAAMEDLAVILRGLRRAGAGLGRSKVTREEIAVICGQATPELSQEIRHWEWHQVNGTFSIWRTGRGGFAIQFQEQEDGSYRWWAGHNFRPVASCSAYMPKTRKRPAMTCGRIAAVVAPVCQVHAGKEYLSNLVAEGLVGGDGNEEADDVA